MILDKEAVDNGAIVDNLAVRLKDSIMITKSYQISNNAVYTTDVSVNGGYTGRTILVIASGNSSNGDNTGSEIGLIRCGLDGNHVTYQKILSMNGDMIAAISCDASGNLTIQSPPWHAITVLLIMNK